LFKISQKRWLQEFNSLHELLKFYQQDDDAAHYESFKVRIHADHVVKDCNEANGYDHERWQLGQLLADEVDVSAVHAVEMFAQKYRQFHAKDLKSNFGFVTSANFDFN